MASSSTVVQGDEIAASDIQLPILSSQSKAFLRTSPPLALPGPDQPTDLLAVSSRFGLLAAAVSNAANEPARSFVIHPISDLRRLLRDSEKRATPELTKPWKRVQVASSEASIVFLRFAQEQTKVVAGCSDGSVKVWALADLENGHESGQRVTPAGPPRRLLALLPNPSAYPSMVACLHHVSEGASHHASVEMLDLASGSFSRLAFGLPSADTAVTAACWSVKGKQLAIGFSNGEILQVSPEDGSVKARLGRAPSEELAATAYIGDLFWIENDVFVVSYSTPAESSEEEPPHEDSLFAVTRTKQGTTTFTAMADPCPPFGLTVLRSKRYAAHIKGWAPCQNQVFLASAPSTDIGLIGRTENGEWATLELDETSRPTLPFSSLDKSSETAPLGLAIDLSLPGSAAQDEEEIPRDPRAAARGEDEKTKLAYVAPTLWVLDSDGSLGGWNILNLDVAGSNGCPEMTRVEPIAAAATDNSSSDQRIEHQHANDTSFGNASATPAFGQSGVAPPASGGFGQKSAFGSSSGFGSVTQNPSPGAFGQPSAFGSAAQSPSPGAFGQPSAFGKPSFGAGAASSFGQGSAFGQPTAFGKPSPVASPAATSSSDSKAPSAFGAFASSSAGKGVSSGFGGFGKPSAFGNAPANGASAGSSIFGQSSSVSNTNFGQPSAFGSTANVGQKSAFGSTAGSGQASAFGSTANVGQKSAFGSTAGSGQASAFGSAAGSGQTTAFGSSTGFGQASSLGSSTGFGQTSAFGSKAASPFSAFGQQQESTGQTSKASQSNGSPGDGANPFASFGKASGGFGGFAKNPSAIASMRSGSASEQASALPATSVFGSPSTASKSSIFGSGGSITPTGPTIAPFSQMPEAKSNVSKSAADDGSKDRTTDDAAESDAGAFGFSSLDDMLNGGTKTAVTERVNSKVKDVGGEATALNEATETSSETASPASGHNHSDADSAADGEPTPLVSTGDRASAFASGTPFSFAPGASKQPIAASESEDAQQAQHAGNTSPSPRSMPLQRPKAEATGAKATMESQSKQEPREKLTFSSFGGPQAASQKGGFAFGVPKPSALTSGSFSFAPQREVSESEADSKAESGAKQMAHPNQVMQGPGRSLDARQPPSLSPMSEATPAEQIGTGHGSERGPGSDGASDVPVAKPATGNGSFATAPVPPNPRTTFGSAFGAFGQRNNATPGRSSPLAQQPYSPEVRRSDPSTDSKPIDSPAFKSAALSDPSKTASSLGPAATVSPLPPAVATASLHAQTPAPPHVAASVGKGPPTLVSSLNHLSPEEVEEEGLQGEFVRTFLTMEKELALLRSNIAQCSAFQAQIRASSGVISGRPADLDSPDAWSFGDLQSLDKVERELTEHVRRLNEVVAERQREARELEGDLVKSEAKRDEAARLLRAHTDPEFAKLVRVRQLGPEHAQNQTKLRSQLSETTEKVRELESYIAELRLRTRDSHQGQQHLRPPSLDSIQRTVRNISVTATTKSLELDELATEWQAASRADPYTTRRSISRVASNKSLPSADIEGDEDPFGSARRGPEGLHGLQSSLNEVLPSATNAGANGQAVRNAIRAQELSADLMAAMMIARKGPVKNESAARSQDPGRFASETDAVPIFRSSDIKIDFAKGPLKIVPSRSTMPTSKMAEHSKQSQGSFLASDVGSRSAVPLFPGRQDTAKAPALHPLSPPPSQQQPDANTPPQPNILASKLFAHSTDSGPAQAGNLPAEASSARPSPAYKPHGSSDAFSSPTFKPSGPSPFSTNAAAAPEFSKHRQAHLSPPAPVPATSLFSFQSGPQKDKALSEATANAPKARGTLSSESDAIAQKAAMPAISATEVKASRVGHATLPNQDQPVSPAFASAATPSKFSFNQFSAKPAADTSSPAPRFSFGQIQESSPPTVGSPFSFANTGGTDVKEATTSAKPTSIFGTSSTPSAFSATSPFSKSSSPLQFTALPETGTFNPGGNAFNITKSDLSVHARRRPPNSKAVALPASSLDSDSGNRGSTPPSDFFAKDSSPAGSVEQRAQPTGFASAFFQKIAQPQQPSSTSTPLSFSPADGASSSTTPKKAPPTKFSFDNSGAAGASGASIVSKPAFSFGSLTRPAQETPKAPAEVPAAPFTFAKASQDTTDGKAAAEASLPVSADTQEANASELPASRRGGDASNLDQSDDATDASEQDVYEKESSEDGEEGEAAGDQEWESDYDDDDDDEEYIDEEEEDEDEEGLSAVDEEEEEEEELAAESEGHETQEQSGEDSDKDGTENDASDEPKQTANATETSSPPRAVADEAQVVAAPPRSEVFGHQPEQRPAASPLAGKEKQGEAERDEELQEAQASPTQSAVQQPEEAPEGSTADDASVPAMQKDEKTSEGAGEASTAAQTAAEEASHKQDTLDNNALANTSRSEAETGPEVGESQELQSDEGSDEDFKADNAPEADITSNPNVAEDTAASDDVEAQQASSAQQSEDVLVEETPSIPNDALTPEVAGQEDTEQETVEDKHEQSVSELAVEDKADATTGAEKESEGSPLILAHDGPEEHKGPSSHSEEEGGGSQAKVDVAKEEEEEEEEAKEEETKEAEAKEEKEEEEEEEEAAASGGHQTKEEGAELEARKEEHHQDDDAVADPEGIEDETKGQPDDVQEAGGAESKSTAPTDRSAGMTYASAAAAAAAPTSLTDAKEATVAAADKTDVTQSAAFASSEGEDPAKAATKD